MKIFKFCIIIFTFLLSSCNENIDKITESCNVNQTAYGQLIKFNFEINIDPSVSGKVYEVGVYLGKSRKDLENKENYHRCVHQGVLDYRTGVTTNLTSSEWFYLIIIAYDGKVYKGEVTKFEEVAIEKIKASEAVDLGLSVKWASCNLGTNTPEGVGGLYGWGDPKGILTSYNNYTIPYDMSEISGTEYDIVKAKLGGKWRIPTKAEWDELKANCRFQKMTKNEKDVYKVTAENGNYIFIPCTYVERSDNQISESPNSRYWTGTIEYRGRGPIIFDLEFINGSYNVMAYDGYAIRPVTD